MSTNMDSLLSDRKQRYGLFKDNAATSQALKDVMRSTAGWVCLAPDMQEALEMVAHKISRILHGDPNYADSWVDISGYATRVVEGLENRLDDLGSGDDAPAATYVHQNLCGCRIRADQQHD